MLINLYSDTQTAIAAAVEGGPVLAFQISVADGVIAVQTVGRTGDKGILPWMS